MAAQGWGLVKKLDTGARIQSLPSIPVNCPVEMVSIRGEHKRPTGPVGPPEGELR